jgi:hypothetical protein
MLFTIEFFRLREGDDAHATLDRITHSGTDLEAVKVKAKSLFIASNGASSSTPHTPPRTSMAPDGVLFFYGPFMLGGTHTAASNAAFDADLKRRDPRWGVRDVDDLGGEAATHGLELRDVVEMPVNNLSLVFVKAGPPPA